MARAGELGVDETLTFLREVDSINLTTSRTRRRPRRKALPVDRSRQAHRRAWGGVQAEQRRRPRLTCTARRRRACSRTVQTWRCTTRGQREGRARFPTLDYVDSAKAIHDADVVMLLTEWEFRTSTPDTGELVRPR